MLHPAKAPLTTAASDPPSSPVPSRRQIVPWLLAAAAYTALIVFFTWPLAVRLTSVLPHDLGDPLFGAYLFWWNAHTLPLTEAWWNAPFFWPAPGALGLSEHLLGFVPVSTPLQWLGADPIATYNILFILSFPLSALAAHALAYRLTARHDAAALAGVLFGFSPYRIAQIAHIQMLWTFWMPIALLALHEYARDGRKRWLVLFGAMWLGQASSNGYYLFFFPVLVSVWVAWFLISRRDWKRALLVTAASAVASLPLVPVLLGYQRIHSALALERSITEIRQLSADLLGFATAAPALLLWKRLSLVPRPEQEVFPGITAPLVILVACALALWRSRGLGAAHPRTQKTLAVFVGLALVIAASPLLFGPWKLSIGSATILSVGNASKPFTVAIWLAVAALAAGARARHAVANQSTFAFYVLAALLMYVLCLGPDPSINGQTFWYKAPYAWLMELPGFSSIRAPARFAALGTLCLSIAAACALTRLTRGVSQNRRTIAAAALCGLAVLDGWIHELELPVIPPRIHALERATDTAAVVELPLGDVMDDLRAMYRSIYHGKPVVNGYAGYNPAAFDVLRTSLDYGDIGALEALGGPLTVVVDPRMDYRQWGRYAALAAAAPVDAESGRRIFTLPAGITADAVHSEDGLAIRSATASAPVDLAALVDGDLFTQWDSLAPQKGDQWIAFDLGRSGRVDGLMLAVGPAYGSQAREIAIDVSLDGQQWNTVFQELGGRAAVAGARQDPILRPVTYAFRPTEARWIRARQTGAVERFHWSICEVAVYGR